MFGPRGIEFVKIKISSKEEAEESIDLIDE
jgi:hypothetical protein